MNSFLMLGLVLFAYMNVWFVLSLILKRNDVADIAWGIGFVLLAWLSYFMSDCHSTRALVVCIIVSIWGVRLALHIQSRNRKKNEDYRYAAWRKEWGKWFLLRSYTQVYLLQGLLLFIISIPILWINKYSNMALTPLDLIGFLVWLIGFVLEVIADYQLAQFKNNPKNKGQLMRSGLWRFSRHPNYFGEVLLWWGIFIMALSVSSGWMTIIGPITITVLILFVSGIPMLERKQKMHPDYKDYASKTSRFIPLPSKNGR